MTPEQQEIVRQIIREELNFIKSDRFLLEKHLQLFDGRNIQLGKTYGTRIGTETGQLLGFYNKLPVDQPAALTAQKTSITHTAPGTEDFAIANLTQTSPYGFVSQDEGNTVLVVIANLQTRLQECENRLEELGLIASN